MAWSPPGAGALRASVRFERRGPAANVGGVVKGGWLPLIARRSARLTPLDGGERDQAGLSKAIEQWELTVRMGSDVTGVTCGDRVVDRRDDRRTFDIAAILDRTERGRWLVMTLTRGAGDGL